VHAHPNGLPHARIGLTVSRRVSLRANRRNRLKRLIRESFRHHQTQLKGLDIVVVARAPANQAELSVLRSSLQQHWQSLQNQ
jgi:ribonuclease P protein component